MWSNNAENPIQGRTLDRIFLIIYSENRGNDLAAVHRCLFTGSAALAARPGG